MAVRQIIVLDRILKIFGNKIDLIRLVIVEGPLMFEDRISKNLRP